MGSGVKQRPSSQDVGITPGWGPGARSQGPLSPQPPAPRLPGLPGQVVAACPALELPCGSVFLPDVWDLQRQAGCLVTCAHRSPAWPGAQSAVRDCDEALAKSPASHAVGLPPGDRSLDEGGTRTDRGHVLVPTGLTARWSQGVSSWSVSRVPARRACSERPCCWQGSGRGSLGPRACSQGRRGLCRK